MKLINHLKTINKHKYYVTMLCFKCGLYKQGLLHDLSKYSPTELKTGAKYWVGTRSPNSIERETIGYSSAWLHHKGRNKHHWEYWVDWKSSNGEYIITKIPLKFMKEMYADMVGASKAYNKGKFNNNEPYMYFIKNCNGWVIDNENRDWLINKLKILARII